MGKISDKNDLADSALRFHPRFYGLKMVRSFVEDFLLERDGLYAV